MTDANNNMSKSIFSVKLSKEQAKEFFGGQLPDPVQNPQKPGFQMNTQAISYSIATAIGLTVLLAMFLSWSGLGAVIKPMERGNLTFSEEARANWPVLAEAEESWKAGHLDRALEQMNSVLNKTLTSDPVTAKQIYISKLIAFLVQERHTQVLRFAEFLHGKFEKDDLFQADVFFFRAHAYYYLDQYGNAINSFDQTVLRGGRFSNQAQDYINELKEID